MTSTKSSSSLFLMGTKTIILVRHGQYRAASEKNPEQLTSLGRRQARLTAKRLSEFKIKRVVHSSMPRAIETAQLIKNQLNFKKRTLSCDQICECVPGFPSHLRKKYGYTDIKKLKKNQTQMERAYRKHFKPSRVDSVDVLVCHGNVIRYLICKVLGVKTLTWRKFDILQCSISIVKIRSKGTNKNVLLSFNETAHLPQKLRTFL